jgi:hypothetical protein
VHAEDDAIGPPVGCEVHPAGQKQGEDESLLATQGLSDPKNQRSQGCKQHRGFHAIHGFLL